MQKKGASKQGKIVEAANLLFYQQGYDHTSFSQIAQAAEIPRGNFYYYFKTKDDILQAVVEYRLESIENNIRLWTKELSEPLPRLKRFVQMVRNSADDVVRYGCPIGSLGTELGKSYPELQEKALRMFDLFRDWLKPEFAKLGYADLADQYTLHLISRMQGIVTMAHLYGDQAFLLREADLLDAWLDSLGTP